jgi:hypothetical protein
MPEKQMKKKYKGKNLDSSLWLAWMGIHENLLSSPSLLHTRVCEGVRFGVFIIGA